MPFVKPGPLTEVSFVLVFLTLNEQVNRCMLECLFNKARISTRMLTFVHRIVCRLITRTLIRLAGWLSGEELNYPRDGSCSRCSRAYESLVSAHKFPIPPPAHNGGQEILLVARFLQMESHIISAFTSGGHLGCDYQLP